VSSVAHRPCRRRHVRHFPHPGLRRERGSRGRHRRAGRAAFDVVVVFRSDASTYRKHLDRDIGRITMTGRLWVVWPKKASVVVTDMSDDVVRTEGLAAGVVDTKVCAIDDTWSGLMFVRRLSDRQ